MPSPGGAGGSAGAAGIGRRRGKRGVPHVKGTWDMKKVTMRKNREIWFFGVCMLELVERSGFGGVH